MTELEQWLDDIQVMKQQYAEPDNVSVDIAEWYSMACFAEKHIEKQQEIIKGLSETIESQKKTMDALIERLQIAKEALNRIANIDHAEGCDSDCVPLHECACFTESEAYIAQSALRIIEPMEK